MVTYALFMMSSSSSSSDSKVGGSKLGSTLVLEKGAPSIFEPGGILTLQQGVALLSSPSPSGEGLEQHVVEEAVAAALSPLEQQEVVGGAEVDWAAVEQHVDDVELLSLVVDCIVVESARALVFAVSIFFFECIFSDCAAASNEAAWTQTLQSGSTI